MNWPWRIYHLSAEPNKVWFYPRIPIADFAGWLKLTPNAMEKISRAVEKARRQSVSPEVQRMILADSPDAFNCHAEEIRLHFCRKYGFAEEGSTVAGHCFCGLRQGQNQYSICFKDHRKIAYPTCYYGVFLNCADWTFGMPQPQLIPTLFWRWEKLLQKKRRL